MARNRKWLSANREKHLEATRRYNREHQDLYNAYNHERRARINNAGGSYTEAHWSFVKELYGNVCVRCGKQVRLTVDHVVPLSKGGSNNFTNIQPLCLPCNSSKGTRIEDYRTFFVRQIRGI